MIKHILTTKCPRACEYCISKNVHIDEYNGPDYVDKLAETYFKFVKTHKQIMFTGGEPTNAKHLYDCWNAASIIFDEVYITSANPVILWDPKSAFRFSAITFSLHNLNDIPKVENGAVIYAAIMADKADKFDLLLPIQLQELGYSGLTINENHFSNDVFNEMEAFGSSYNMRKEFDDKKQILIYLENRRFSIKINRRGKCINDGTVYIMPDLSTRNSFEEFLK